MAFLLAKRLENQLTTKSRLTDDSYNPSNLENLQLPPGVQLPTDWLSFDEASADAFIDEMTQEAEKRSQGIRAADAGIALLKTDTELVKRMKKLIELAAKNEIAREEAFKEFQELNHKLKVVRAKAGIGLAAGIEKENVGFAAYRRQLQEGLRRVTNLAAGGTHEGALSLTGSKPTENPIKLVS
ncbi:MAG: hypothetical protein AAFS06_17520 [Cyanobacteria bacterium J06631_12]